MTFSFLSLENTTILPKSHLSISTSNPDLYKIENLLSPTIDPDQFDGVKVTCSPIKRKLKKTRSLPEINQVVMPTDDNSVEYKVKTKRGSSIKEDRSNIISKFLRRLPSSASSNKKRLVINPLDDLRCVSQVIGFEELSENIRRIRLCKRNSDEKFGLYIRDGYSNSIEENSEVTNSYNKRTQGVFVSRFIPGGLAELSGLLSINDEIIAINGTSVKGIPLTEVYAMMRTSKDELVLSIKPSKPIMS